MSGAERVEPLLHARIGNYELLEELGRGGMGTVYRAEHPQIGKQVAIKVLHREHAATRDAAERYFLEARAANEIRHPNVVDVIDCGVAAVEGHGDVRYSIMELLEGAPLRDEIARGAIEPARAIAIAIEVGRALAAAHDKGIVHRDVKPENIFVLAGDALRVKVLDFGIAKLVDNGPQGRLTRSGVVLGTPAYMAPEQLEAGDIDGRCDVYALATVLYEMLGGAAPFPDETTARAVWRRMNEVPRLAPRVADALPNGVEDLLASALAPAPHERPDMASFVRGLADPSAWPASVPRRQTVTAASPVAVRRHTRYRVLYLALGVITALAIAAVVTLIGTFRPPTPVIVPHVSLDVDAGVATPSPTIAIAVTSTPPDAEVFVGDEAAPRGTTPTTITLARGGGTVAIRVHREQFVDVRRSIALLDNARVDVTLVAVPATPATTGSGSASKRVVPPDAGVPPPRNNGSGDNLMQPRHP